MALVSSSFRALSGAVVSLALTACFPSNPSFADARQPRGVRVLGAVAEPASGVPGAELVVQLEAFDGAPLLEELQRAAGVLDEAAPSAGAAPLSVAWLGGCHNPPGDTPSGCYPLLQQIAARLPDPLPESSEEVTREQAEFFGVGTRFALRIPETILEGRQLQTSAPPFGVSFSFFVVCRGVLRPAPGVVGAVPLSCQDRDTGEPLASDGFVQGFVTTYTYERALNLAPELVGAPIDGAELPEVRCESDADCAGVSVAELATACARPLAPAFSLGEPPPQRCLPLVPRCTAPPCASHELLPELSPASVEEDPSAAPPGGVPPREIVWVRYFGFGGFSRAQALINDRATGLNPDYALRWTAPPLAVDSPLPVWAVVQDNRGGTAIARWDFLVRDVSGSD
jgi:hypothetical protein